MEAHIEARTLLLAAEQVREHGHRNADGSFNLGQIKLVMSYDGYTITLSQRNCMLSIYFHNKVKADYQRLQDLEEFYETLVRISEGKT